MIFITNDFLLKMPKIAPFGIFLFSFVFNHPDIFRPILTSSAENWYQHS